MITRAYELLAQTRSAIVTATFEDALAQEERPNMPGSAKDSWCHALPESLEQLQPNRLRLKQR